MSETLEPALPGDLDERPSGSYASCARQGRGAIRVAALGVLLEMLEASLEEA